MALYRIEIVKGLAIETDSITLYRAFKRNTENGQIKIDNIKLPRNKILVFQTELRSELVMRAYIDCINKEDNDGKETKR